MSEERKSRYELFFEEEERKAQPTKRCCRCKQVKPLSEYHKDSGKRLGIRDACKRCLNTASRKYKGPEDRFWKHYHSHVVQNGRCLEWTGAYAAGQPYAQFKGKGTTLRRIVYQLSIGELTPNDVVSTNCRNPKCVKQSHLLKLTREEFDTLLRNNSPTGSTNGNHTRPESRLRGEMNSQAKLTESKVQQIRATYARGGITFMELARQYEVSNVTIQRIVDRENWAHVE